MAKATDKYNEAVENEQQLVDWFIDGCADKNDLVIGAEHEKFIFYRDDLSAVTYEGSNGRSGIKDLLEYIESNFDWEPKYEDGNLIRLEKNGASITLEPSGQIELSGAPLKTVHEIAKETYDHFEQLTEACDAFGMDILGLGYHPTQTLSDAPMMPMSRFKIFNEFFKENDYDSALNLASSTCSTQVNLGYTSEEDMVKKLRVSLALQPIATALFANSPFDSGEDSGNKSNRSHITENAADGRYGFMMPVAFEEDFGFKKYTDFVMNMPVLGAYEGDHFEFLHGKRLPFNQCVQKHSIHMDDDHEHLLTMNDWFNHINTIWPEVRMRQWLEMRGTDVGSSTEMINALPAFWVGILYDDKALDKAYDLIKDWTEEDRSYLRTQAAIDGLQTEFMGTTIQEITKNVLALSELGLNNRNIKNEQGDNEAMYLKPLHEIVETGLTQADILKDKYNNEWNENISKIFTECSFGAAKKHLLPTTKVTNKDTTPNNTVKNRAIRRSNN